MTKITFDNNIHGKAASNVFKFQLEGMGYEVEQYTYGGKIALSLECEQVELDPKELNGFGIDVGRANIKRPTNVRYRGEEDEATKYKNEPTTRVTLSIPISLFNAIESQATAEGMTRAAFIVSILREAYR